MFKKILSLFSKSTPEAPKPAPAKFDRPRRGRQPMATPPRSAVAAVASLPVSAPPTGKLSPAPRPNRDQTISAAASPKANAALTLHLASRARRAHAIPNDPSSQTKSLVLLAHRARVAAHRE
jgi:hypothetical protein